MATVRRPLDGLRVVVTRFRQPGDPLRTELAGLGAEVIDVPTIEIRPLPYGPGIETALAKLGRTALAVFTSANSVRFFFSMLEISGRGLEALAGCRVCAVGPSTAKALEDFGVLPDLVAREYTAEGLGAVLMGWDVAGQRILIPRVRVARDSLPALLTSRGATVEVLPLYETVCPAEAARLLEEAFTMGVVDLVTFTSSSSVTNFVRALTPVVPLEQLRRQRTQVACLGPVTAETARRLGLHVDIMPHEYTVPALVQAIVKTYFQFHL